MVEQVKTAVRPAPAEAVRPAPAEAEAFAEAVRPAPAEAVRPAPAEAEAFAEAVRPAPAEAPVAFTKMKNVSGKTLQLTCGAVAPEKEVAFNAAEFSMLHMFLEGVA